MSNSCLFINFIIWSTPLVYHMFNHRPSPLKDFFRKSLRKQAYNSVYIVIYVEVDPFKLLTIFDLFTFCVAGSWHTREPNCRQTGSRSCHPRSQGSGQQSSHHGDNVKCSRWTFSNIELCFEKTNQCINDICVCSFVCISNKMWIINVCVF